ncbi:hypothetical protein PILCRDRAFT_817524 [Piloderma croceum F 1598]|uniref:Uncharacterized protein n=1 Tax=Piloderma croceum (strain F 1598) TaxID=765440 RepID=A0A0C3G4A8_PILCF|nr:hypothetical protein PILCRDRAFT_817524 [Piloderma croceum F 1598]
MDFRFDGSYDIWKSDRILDEEHWNVVAENVPVVFVGVELGRKTANGVGASTRSCTVLNHVKMGVVFDGSVKTQSGPNVYFEAVLSKTLIKVTVSTGALSMPSDHLGFSACEYSCLVTKKNGAYQLSVSEIFTPKSIVSFWPLRGSCTSLSKST